MRIALGASRWNVLGLILRQGMTLVLGESADRLPGDAFDRTSAQQDALRRQRGRSNQRGGRGCNAAGGGAGGLLPAGPMG